MVQKPCREVLELRKSIDYALEELSNFKKRYTFNQNINSIEVECLIKIDLFNKIDIKFCFAKNEFLAVRVEGNNNNIILDRTFAGNTNFSDYYSGIFEANFINVNDYLKVHIFLDKNTIEVFANGGITNFSSLIFPNECLKSLEITSGAGQEEFEIINMYELF